MNPSGNTEKDTEQSKQTQDTSAEKVNVVKSMVTRERGYAIICAENTSQTTAEGQNKQMCDKLVAINNEFKASRDKIAKRLLDNKASPEMWQQFFSQQDQLDGQLPVISNLDLTNPSEAKKRVEEEVDKFLPSWDEYVNKYELKTLQEAEKEAWRKDYKELRDYIIQRNMARYAIGGIFQANAVFDDAAVRDHVKRLASEDMLLAANKKGRVDEEYMQKLQEKNKNIQLDSKEQRDEFKQWLEQTTIKVNDTEGLYYKLDLSGEKVFFLEEISQRNIDIVFANKTHKDVLTFNNLPKDKHQMVEDSGIMHWKKVEINGKEPKLSKTRPDKPGKWGQWLNNIFREHKRSGPDLCKRLVQVVSKDPQKRQEFWSDVCRDCQDKKILDKVLDSFSKETRDSLQQDLIRRIEEEEKHLAVEETNLQGKERDNVKIRKQESEIRRDVACQEMAVLAGRKKEHMLPFWNDLPPEMAERVCAKLDEGAREVLLKVATKCLNDAVAKLRKTEADVKKARKEVDKLQDQPKKQAELKKAKEKLQKKEAELQTVKESCIKEKKKCDAFFLQYGGALNIAKRLDNKTKEYLYQSDKKDNLKRLAGAIDGQGNFIKKSGELVDGITEFKSNNPSPELNSYLTKQQELLKKRIELMKKEQRWADEQKKAIEGGELSENAERTIAVETEPLRKEIQELEEGNKKLDDNVKNEEDRKVVDQVKVEVEKNRAAMQKLGVEQREIKKVLADFALAQRRFGVFSDSSSMAVADKSKATKSIVNPKTREDAVSEERDTPVEKKKDIEEREESLRLDLK